MRQHPIVASVPSLLRIGGPSAIGWFVVSVVVLPVDGMLWGWSSAHVGQEVLVGFPSVTDPDSACSVVLVASILRLIASFQHGAPHLVLRGPMGTDGISVRGASNSGSVRHQASAGLRSPRHEMVLANHGFHSAGASTAPVLPFGVVILFRENREPAKGLAQVKQPPSHRIPRFLAQSRIINSNTDAWLRPIPSARMASSFAASSVSLKLVAFLFGIMLLYCMMHYIGRIIWEPLRPADEVR